MCEPPSRRLESWPLPSHSTSTYTYGVTIEPRAYGANNNYLLTLSDIWCFKKEKKKKKIVSFEVLVFHPLKIVKN